jgi:hypothetical protein
MKRFYGSMCKHAWRNIQMFFFCDHLLGSLFWAPASTNRPPEKELDEKRNLVLQLH